MKKESKQPSKPVNKNLTPEETAGEFFVNLFIEVLQPAFESYRTQANAEVHEQEPTGEKNNTKYTPPRNH